MKKVLIITYYWIPSGGPGVQRWLKFVKYLPDFGIEPVVYIPENPSYPIVDKNLKKDFSNLTVLKQKIREPYGFASLFSKKKTQKISSGIIPKKKNQSLLERILLYIRGNFFIPDARVLWVKPSVKFLEKYIRENQIETVITTGPPHSLHLIGLGLQQKLNIRWIADFRDPWTSIVYHKDLKLSAASQAKHKELERKVLQAAHQIIVTSPSTKAEFEQITSKPITVITNGYDVENIEKQPLDEKFSLAHIGSFLSERNPRILWKALRELIKENKDFSNDFQLKLIGIVSEEVLETIREFKLENYINNLGYLSHKQSVEEQRKSQVLLLIESDSDQTKAIIPGKLFEYMVSGRPILAIANDESDIKDIIVSTNTGVFFDYSEKERLKDVILNYYKQYKENNLKSHPIGLQQFSRKNLTRKLSEVL
ncbi:MAG: glycosyltransferase family 4 protein [Flavobacteriaceae bacterium]